jgi:hypothetical protein
VLIKVFRQQCDPFDARVVSFGHDLRPIFKVQTFIPFDVHDLFRSTQEDSFQVRFQLLPRYGFLIDFEQRKLTLRAS